MVSLDDAVLARYERHGKRYELLVDPDLVESHHAGDRPSLDDLLAIDAVFHDARAGDRPSDEDLQMAFETNDLAAIVDRILEKGSIQLTAAQRKVRVERNRQAVVHRIVNEAIDPRTKSPHPTSRIELAIAEAKVTFDPFKDLDSQFELAVKALRPLLPLSFDVVRLAIKVRGQAYGGLTRLVRERIKKEEWLPDGSFACVIEIPMARKGDLLARIGRLDPDALVRDLPG